MPFKSRKQRAFLKRRHPRIYARWKRRYGTRIRPKNGRGKKR